MLSNKTDIVKQIIEGKHELSNKIQNSQKPLIIIGESALNLNSGKYIFEGMKNYLSSLNKINDEWNSLNILLKNASSAGSYDLNIFVPSSSSFYQLAFELSSSCHLAFAY